jgi:hypothetical protein
MCLFNVHVAYEANIYEEEDKPFTSSLNNCHLHMMWIQFPLNKRKEKKMEKTPVFYLTLSFETWFYFIALCTFLPVFQRDYVVR